MSATMIYLSQLLLSPRSAQVRAEARNPYEMHRTLSRAFGDDPTAWDEARVLFRLEDPVGDALPLLVQSRGVRPDWSFLGRVGGGYLADDAPRVKEIALPTLPEGTRLGFRLRANPTVKRDGRRVGLYAEQERLDWLGRKGREVCGFRLLHATVRNEDTVRCRTATSGQIAVFSACRFDGVLTVTDPEAFSAAWSDGVGAAKGIGFGLLSLAPAKQ